MTGASTLVFKHISGPSLKVLERRAAILQSRLGLQLYWFDVQWVEHEQKWIAFYRIDSKAAALEPEKFEDMGEVE